MCAQSFTAPTLQTTDVKVVNGTSDAVATLKVSAPTSLHTIEFKTQGLVATPVVELKLRGGSDVVVHLIRSPRAPGATFDTFSNVAIINLPRGDYSFVANQKGDALAIATTPWATHAPQIDIVPTAESRQFNAVQIWIANLDEIAARARQFLAKNPSLRVVGKAVTHDLWDGGVFPQSLRGTSNGSSAHGISTAALFAGGDKTLWLQMWHVPKQTCMTMLKHLLAQGKTQSYNYVYVNDNNSYANVLDHPQRLTDLDGLVAENCASKPNIVTLGVPLQ